MRRPSVGLYEQVTREHLRDLERVSEGAALEPLHGLYQRAFDDLVRRSRGLFKGELNDSFTAHHRRLVLVQLRQGVREMSLRVSGALVDHAQTVARDSRRTAVRDIARLESHFTGTTPILPVREAARFVGAIADGRPRSLLRDASRHGLLPGRVQTSMGRYGARLVSAMEEGLAQSIIQNETLDGAIDRIVDVADLNWWQAERIARTESAYAWNSAHADAIEDAATDLPDLWMRWSEHVSDATGAALDNRVGPDSVALHGQVAPPGGEFTMPTAELVDAKWWGLKFEFPPNRPHDRAALAPVRPHWGVPRCWTWNGVEKVPWPAE